ncbi:MAG: DUF5063 domain-containing protein [Bacteroidales bacterium]
MADTKILDFITVSAEYCAFLEQVNSFSQKDFISKSQKILCLLYLKTSVLEPDNDVDGFSVQYVTEDDYTYIQSHVAEKLADFDTFLDVQEPDRYESGETVSVRISECFADIYQDIRECLERYKNGNDEAQQNALFECVLNFKTIWGPRTLALISELHNILYCSTTIFTDDK